MKSCEGFCGEGFWLGTRRLGRSIPAAGCDGQANAGPRQNTRRPEGFRAKDRLASLLLGHRPLRVRSLVAPRHPAFSPKTEPLAVFNQTPNSCRPDLVGFVNGLPLVVIELKKPGVPARAAFDEPFRATSPCGICDGADCWQASNSGSCRSACRTQSGLPPASPGWQVGQVP